MSVIKTKNLVMAALFAVLTALGSFIQIPAPIAPISLQYFFTVASGVFLGKKWGPASQLLYMAMGLLGLPVFSGGGGFSYVLTPVFGFIIGFVVSSWVSGILSFSQKRFFKILPACLLATLAMYAIALPYMYLIIRFYIRSVPDILYIVQFGMLIFLPGDILKCVLCSVLGQRIPASLRPSA